MANSPLKTMLKHFPSFFFCFVVLYIVAYRWTTTSEHPQVQRDFFNYVCKRFETSDQLSSFVWSHRGHFSGREVDASRSAQQALISANVFNFDVDVSFADDVFYVAHPSKLNKFTTPSQRGDSLQTVEAFLTTLGEVRAPWSSTNRTLVVSPFVTLEPKFEETKLWLRLLEQLSRGVGNLSPANTALVVNEPSQLRLIEEFFRDRPDASAISVAIAYRSLPKTSADYSWSQDIEGAEAAARCCGLKQHSRRLRQVYMPDVKLVAELPSRFRFRRKSGSNSLLVPWLVDTEEDLMLALRQRVSGVVSNAAPALLASLRSRFDELC